jgi:hypothetical protein
MDLEQRLKQLESHHDWHGIVEAMEQGLGSTQDATLRRTFIFGSGECSTLSSCRVCAR